MNSHELTLSFAGAGDAVELCEVTFKPCGANRVFHSVRGKSCGAFRGAGSFQWTSAVQGLCVLLLRAKAAAKGSSVEPRLVGEKGSMASSLDYAVSKAPMWISEMFGVQSSGDLVVRRLVLISNSNRKRPGPVVVGLNERFFSPAMIQVRVDGQEVTSLAGLHDLLEKIESGRDCDAAEVHPFVKPQQPQFKMAS
jgi:hypothetical protein